MILEVLSDFFLLLSTDKKTITMRNLIDFDIFITRKEYEDLHHSILRLLTDLLYFSSKQNNIQLESNIDSQLTTKVQRIINDKYKDDKGNSYQTQYKRGNEVKKLKEKEVKLYYLTQLRNSQLPLVIDPILFISFFNNGSSKYRNTVNKFMARIKPLMAEKVKNSNGNVGANNGNGNNNTADDISHSELDKSNPNNKSGLSSVSDKEGMLQNKEKFLDVLNQVKLGLIKEEVHEENNGGKLKESIKKDNTIIDKDDIQINIKDSKERKNSIKNQNTNDLNDHKMDENKEKNKKKKKKKEDTKCGCLIF